MKFIVTILFLFSVFNSKAQVSNLKSDWLTPELSQLIDDSFGWDIQIDSLNQIIRVPFTLSTNRENENYYLKSFPSTSDLIDTSKYYNRINIGYLELNYSGKNKRTKKCFMVDSKFMLDIDSNKVKNEYAQLIPDGEFSIYFQNMEIFQRAYRLLFEIMWLAIIYDTFSAKECEILRKLLAPSLGPENGPDVFALIALMNIINYSDNSSN